MMVVYGRAAVGGPSSIMPLPESRHFLVADELAAFRLGAALLDRGPLLIGHLQRPAVLCFDGEKDFHSVGLSLFRPCADAFQNGVNLIFGHASSLARAVFSAQKIPGASYPPRTRPYFPFIACPAASLPAARAL